MRFLILGGLVGRNEKKTWKKITRSLGMVGPGFENAKNLGRSDDGKRRKKRGWPDN